MQARDIQRKHVFWWCDKCCKCLQLGTFLFGRFNFPPSVGYTHEGTSWILWSIQNQDHQWSSISNSQQLWRYHIPPKNNNFSPNFANVTSMGRTPAHLPVVHVFPAFMLRTGAGGGLMWMGNQSHQTQVTSFWLSCGRGNYWVIWFCSFWEARSTLYYIDTSRLSMIF